MSAPEHEPNRECPVCGYRMWVGPVKSPVEVTFLAFCPVDGYELRHMDALGEIEAELSGEPKTFDQFCESENVLGVIKAEVKE